VDHEVPELFERRTPRLVAAKSVVVVADPAVARSIVM
jgi:hypothetical protein